MRRAIVAGLVVGAIGCASGGDDGRDGGDSVGDAALRDAAPIADAGRDAGRIVAGDAGPDTGAPLPRCEGPAITSPPEGLVAWFEAPRIAWEAVDGATSYQVAIAPTIEGLDSAALATTTTATEWTPPPHMASRYFVRVTAQPNGARCQRDYVVRGLAIAPNATSDQTFCGGRGTTQIAYSVAVLGDTVFSSFNIAGAGVCRYDAATLAYRDQIPGLGGEFRSFAVVADPGSQRLYATYFPFLSSCSDRLDRLAVIEQPTTAASVSYLNVGVESAIAAAFANDRIHLSGLNQQSCYFENTQCVLDEDRTQCTRGSSAWLSYDLARRMELGHGGSPWGTPGIAADALRVYRGGYLDDLNVHDASSGARLFATTVGGAVRGLLRIDGGGGRYLLATTLDSQLIVFKLLADPVTRPEDLLEVQRVATADAYWQGAFDAARGRLYFPAQAMRRIVRHDLVP